MRREQGKEMQQIGRSKAAQGSLEALERILLLRLPARASPAASPSGPSSASAPAPPSPAAPPGLVERHHELAALCSVGGRRNVGRGVGGGGRWRGGGGGDGGDAGHEVVGDVLHVGLDAGGLQGRVVPEVREVHRVEREVGLAERSSRGQRQKIINARAPERESTLR